jgi:hypothetical protein
MYCAESIYSAILCINTHETRLLFIFHPIEQKDSEEMKMINQENVQTTDAQFAEKCRKALEQSYGLNIPMPKAANSKDSLNKKFKLF